MSDESTPSRTFRLNMRRLREQQELSQGELAQRLTANGWPVLGYQTTIARVEAGGRPVKLDEALAVADALGHPLETLLQASGPFAAFRHLDDDVQETQEAWNELATQAGGFVIHHALLEDSRADVAARLEAGEYGPNLAAPARTLLEAAQAVLGLTVEGAIQEGRTYAPVVLEETRQERAAKTWEDEDNA